ncbi:STAS domain-containing protein [Actinocrinis puniceicyclus]|uniref:STAS domain-containing protein n=1 Tax=Actinocrinis puniceicyclus TaxID=977794 RepID=A0A8J8BG37_9ACTN|nr:STAS domain-containing protein [Actinocrinis puniceicyclus]MBS2965349.1 STAS domain-containing protein [Actinocrinis puniceicyclus]
MTPAVYTLKVGTEERDPPAVAVAVAVVTGEVDMTNAAAFAAEVTQSAAERPTVLDLGDLLYIDSAGFAALHRLVAGHPVCVALPAHSPIRRAAMLVGLPHRDTVEAAAAALGCGPAARG